MNIGDIPHAIQLAIGPVFLLTGIAGILNVVAGRLARIIDRGRQLTEGGTAAAAIASLVEVELQSLDRRRRLTSAAITSCTLAALLVCMVIAALFLEAFLTVHLGLAIGILFMTATLALIHGLAYFLFEVHVATRTIRITSPRPPRP